jgi:hypothetical protein
MDGETPWSTLDDLADRLAGRDRDVGRLVAAIEPGSDLDSAAVREHESSGVSIGGVSGSMTPALLDPATPTAVGPSRDHRTVCPHLRRATSPRPGGTQPPP